MKQEEYTEDIEALKQKYNKNRSPEEILRLWNGMKYYRRLIAITTDPELTELYEETMGKIRNLLFKPELCLKNK